MYSKVKNTFNIDQVWSKIELLDTKSYAFHLSNTILSKYFFRFNLNQLRLKQLNRRRTVSTHCLTEEKVHRNRDSYCSIMLQVEGPVHSHVVTGGLEESSLDAFVKDQFEGFCKNDQESNLNDLKFFGGELYFMLWLYQSI